MKKLLLLAFIGISVAANAQKQKNKDVDFASRYAEGITPAALKEKLSIIASAEMEGRETASAGQRKAAAYIENTFQKLGLQPGTTGGYQMQFPIYQDTIIDASLTVKKELQTLGKSYFFDVASAANGTFDIDEIVYVNYGIKNSLRNDYEQVDVNGKWVLFIEGTPNSAAYAEDDSPYSNKAKTEIAKQMGAKGIFILRKELPKRQNDFTKSRMSLTKPTYSTVPVISVNNDLAHDLLSLNPSRPLESINIIPNGDYRSNTRFSVYKRTLQLQSSNVLALLPGTDKKDEYVFVTAHYDHLGRKGNDIFFGADDDGSGTTSVLQIAEAFAKAKNEGHGPRRSIVFMTVSGEEKGLLGSKFYGDFPAYPLSKTSVDLNIDMVGRIDPGFKGDSLNYLYVIGDDKLSSDLRPIADSVNNKYGHLTLDRRYNDLNDPNRFYYRSDHYNFAKNGVPVIFYFNGTHADYHRTTDTVDKINFALMAKRGKYIFHTAWELANRDNMVKRDIPLKH